MKLAYRNRPVLIENIGNGKDVILTKYLSGLRVSYEILKLMNACFQSNISKHSTRKRYQMRDEHKTKGQLIAELEELRRQLAAKDASFERGQEYRDLFENAAVGYLVVGVDGNITSANRYITERLGYSPDELVGRSMAELNADMPETKAIVGELVSRLRAGGVFSQSELMLKRKDGNQIWVTLSASPIFNPEGLAVASRATIMDITERKRAETALKESEARYHTLVEKSNDGIIIISSGLLEFANSRMVELTGFSINEVLGKPFIDFLAPEDRMLVMGRYKRRMAGEKVLSRYEITIISKDGKGIPVEISASLIEYQGKPADMAIVRDVTERKKLQGQLILTDRLASIGELAAGVAHELNNPLTSVIGFSELILGHDLPPEIRDDLMIVKKEAERISRIVQNLLTFARAQSAQKQVLNINDVIVKVLELRAYEQKVNNIQVVKRLADVPDIIADYSQLQQVFVNLIINAEYFMTEAHGKGVLTVITERADDMVRVSVTDDGPGISEKNMRRIFSPFSTTKAVGKGTGLGLSICHGIVTAHGGSIRAESQPGEGTTFIVELPVAGTS